jgi:8-oxo-dGTP pyrophosphatase MutT (NUDIX family)
MKKIIAAGGLVLNDKNELLMIFRRGYWDLPKGKLDKGETIEACAVREVKEETGLTDVTITKFIGLTNHQYFDRHINKEVNKESHWYEMTVSGKQKLIPQTEEDITEIRWVKQKDIPTLLSQSYANIVEIIEKAGIIN